MARPRGPWTEEQDDMLRELVAGGKSVVLMAAKLKRSFHQIRTRARTLGISVESIRDSRKKLGFVSDRKSG